MRDDETPILIDLAHEAPFTLGAAKVLPSTREVVAGDRTDILEPRVMQVLVALARRRGFVVSRNDLIASCWDGRIVGEDAINRAIAGVRRAGARSGGYAVETVVRVGYRLDEAQVSTPSTRIERIELPEIQARGARPYASTIAQAAIMRTAVVGYSRMIEDDQAGVLAMARAVHEQLARLVEAHDGRMVSVRGSGAIALFAEAADALECATEFQHDIAELGLGVAAERAIRCRVGLHYGPVIVDEGALVGEAAKIAAQLAQLADPSAVNLSDALRSASHRPEPMTDLGFHQLLGVDAPVRIWRIRSADEQSEGTSAADSADLTTASLGAGLPAVAVLPFEHPADDREQTYLAEGIADDVIAALSRFTWLFVLSRHASLNYRKPGADIAQMRADLGVRYVVTGRLMCRDDNLRLAVTLTDCIKGDILWSRRFDGPIADIFTIQDEITAMIVGALEPAVMRREEQHAASATPRSLRHWDLFIRGRWHFWQLTIGHIAKAREILSQALALKPDHAPTLSLLAYTHCSRLWSGWADDPEAEIAEARRLATRAVRADGEDAVAHYTLGTVLTLTGDLEKALVEQRRALELNPNHAGAMGEMGRCLANLGRYDEAMASLDRAIRSSPGDAHRFLWFRDKAIAAFIAERYDEAVAFAHESVTLRPDIFLGHYLLAACWAAAGSPDKGRQALEEGRRIIPTYSLATLKLGHPFGRPEDLARFVGALRSCGWDE
jgi:TolB-like protein/class 3 adenylate cyclase